MLKTVEAKVSAYSKFNQCNIIRYEEDGYLKYAACPDDVSVSVGDTVEVFSDDHVNYRGIGGIVVKVINAVKAAF